MCPPVSGGTASLVFVDELTASLNLGIRSGLIHNHPGGSAFSGDGIGKKNWDSTVRSWLRGKGRRTDRAQVIWRKRTGNNETLQL